jgi:hypothetical protein
MDSLQIGDIGVLNSNINVLIKPPAINMLHNEGAFDNISTEIGKYEEIVCGCKVVITKIIGGIFEELEVTLFSKPDKVFTISKKHITLLDYYTVNGRLYHKSVGDIRKKVKFESIW